MNLLLPSTIFDLDFSKSDSYGGSGQTWTNRATACADGSAPSAYNFNFGAANTVNTDDPTFVGSAGDRAAYALLDGGDCFGLASGVNTAFLNALHKTAGGTPFWLALLMQMGDQTTASVALSTKTASSTLGFNAQFSSAEVFRLQQTGDSTLTTTTSTSDHGSITVGTDCLVIASYTGSNVMRSWVGSRAKVERAMTFNATSSNASGYLTIGGQGNAGLGKLANGTRIYAASMGNAAIDNESAALIANIYNARRKKFFL